VATGDRTTGTGGNASLGELVKDLTEQMSRLVRHEVQLAKVELQDKGKQAGVGVGFFGGAGVVALLGAQALVACAILALALAVEPWLAALLVGIVLLAGAGLLAIVGRSRLKRAAPAVPQQTVENVKQDIATVKEHAKP
jgi:uncharacterized membrane protein YqjE